MRAKLTRKFVDTGYDATPMVPCSELNDIFDLQGQSFAIEKKRLSQWEQVCTLLDDSRWF